MGGDFSMNSEILSSSDILKKFRISPTTLWRWRQKGFIPKPDYQIGARPYWDAEELKEHLKQTTAR
jgi:predicted DNA-binding transcriptional regulator AlpA